MQVEMDRILDRHTHMECWPAEGSSGDEVCFPIGGGEAERKHCTALHLLADAAVAAARSPGRRAD